MCLSIFLELYTYYHKLLLETFKKRLYLSIFRERGREEGREGEKHRRAVASRMCPSRGPTCSPGLRLDREWSRRPFDFWDDAQPAEPEVDLGN